MRLQHLENGSSLHINCVVVVAQRVSLRKKCEFVAYSSCGSTSELIQIPRNNGCQSGLEKASWGNVVRQLYIVYLDLEPLVLDIEINSKKGSVYNARVRLHTFVLYFDRRPKVVLDLFQTSIWWESNVLKINVIPFLYIYRLV